METKVLSEKVREHTDLAFKMGNLWKLQKFHLW